MAQQIFLIRHESRRYALRHVHGFVNIPVDARESSRSHADDSEIHFAELHRAADHGWITAKLRVPGGITDYDNGLAIFVRAKSPAQCRPDAQDVEKIGRDRQAKHEFRGSIRTRVETDRNV